jgi:hypothetical protein
MNDIVKDWLLFLSVVIGIFFLCVGCQSPATIYSNGLILWFSTSAIGIGYGEYVEVPAGGKLSRATTNDVSSIIRNERDYHNNNIKIDNSLTGTNDSQQEVERVSP